MEHVTEPPAGGALPAIGSVVAIAVVVVAAVVLWARLAEGQGAARPGPPGSDEPVPTELAGGYEPGDVPEPVTATTDQPVVGARLLDELPDGARDCAAHDVQWESGPEIEVALVTPDGLFASMVGTGTGSFGPPGGEAPQRWRVGCQLEWHGGRWQGGGVSMGPADDHIGGGFGGGFSCCDRRGLATATADVAVPDGAEWALQDRGEWLLAYPVAGQVRLPLTWKFSQPRFGPGRSVPTHVLFVDGDGREISEEWVGH